MVTSERKRNPPPAFFEARKKRRVEGRQSPHGLTDTDTAQGARQESRGGAVEEKMKKFLAWCGPDIQLRIEQTSDEVGELWICGVFLRPTIFKFEEKLIPSYPTPTKFQARSEDSAKRMAEATIRNDPRYSCELGEWVDLSDLSQEEWRAGEQGWLMTREAKRE
jgi:hypothetical protein